MTSSPDLGVDQRYERWKNNLIDLSLKNRLLNFKEARLRSLRVKEPAPQVLFDRLVRKEALVLLKEEADESDADRVDVKFEVDEEELDSALNNIRLKARTSMQEGGQNVLFLTFGMLEWHELDDKEKILRSPLVMMPVELKRGNFFEPFRLVISNDDVILNPTLGQKMISDIELELPAMPADEDDVVLKDYLSSVERSIAKMTEWKVTDEVHLGLFSFGKLRMYRDLEDAKWIATSNPLVRGLAGDAIALRDLPKDSIKAEELDDSVAPSDTFQILDADSSQQEAVEAAKKGVSFVLQGPPGTGKSQTIANIIAECIASGKSVLFASEKMAALEVVKKRLDEQGLGDLCLELHSHKADKNAVVEELFRVLDLPAPQHAEDGELVELARARKDLNNYVRELHQPRGALNLSAFQMLSEVSRLHDIPDVNLELIDPLEITPTIRSETLAMAQRIGASATIISSLNAHPWKDCRTTAWEVGLDARLLEVLNGIKQPLEDLVVRTNEVCSSFQMQEPSTLEDIGSRVALFQKILSTPHPLPSWFQSDIGMLISTFMAAKKAHLDVAEGEAWLHQNYDPGIINADVASMSKRFAAPKGMFGLLDEERRGDMETLRSFRSSHDKLSYEAAAADLLRISSLKTAGTQLFSDGPSWQKSFGSFYRGRETDWEALDHALSWTRDIIMAYGIKGDARIVPMLCGTENMPNMAQSVDLMVRSWFALDGHLANVDAYFDSAMILKGRAGLRSMPWRELLEWSDIHISSTASLREVIDARSLFSECRGMKLEALFNAVADGKVKGQDAEDAYLKRLYLSSLDVVRTKSEPLRNFSSAIQEQHRSSFAIMDKRQLKTASGRILAKANLKKISVLEWDRKTKDPEEPKLRREHGKKRGRKPIRQLFTDMPELVTALKPCLLMSPLSVSQYLDASVFKFDLVIFDEASQIRPEDAVGVIMRGRQMIIVGDTHQLPPTSFFARLGDDEEDDDDKEGVQDLESILDECATISIPQKMLLWHYRSRDETLIAFSNYHFYENRLSTFPSAAGISMPGITYEYVPDARYERGGSRRNIGEAVRAVDLIMKHFQTTPEMSLGVVAFSEAQQLAILETLEKRVKQHPDLKDYFREDRDNAFFVKNLESVQGDERDVMIFSIGYGKDAEGKMTMNFGPLNRAGGERRLNVAITRARRHVIVVSSIDPADIDPSKSSGEGAALLKAYLDFAKSNGDRRTLFAQKDASKEAIPDVLIDHVLHALTSKGLKVQRQVGFSDYRIDMAVQDEHDAFILGIELDGPSYRSAKTARDRDRLRGEVLSSLGWNIHRIWSPDWVKDPDAEVKKVLQAIEDAKRAKSDAIVETKVGTTSIEVPAEKGRNVVVSTAPVVRNEAVPQARAATTSQAAVLYPSSPTYVQYKQADLKAMGDLRTELTADPASAAKKALVRIVREEGPLHSSVALSRLNEFLASNPESKDRVMYDRVLRDAAIEGEIVAKAEFLWPKGMQIPPLRKPLWSSPSRDIGLIDGVELELAILNAFKSDRELSTESVVNRVGFFFGHGKVPESSKQRINEAIDRLAASGYLRHNGSFVVRTR